MRRDPSGDVSKLVCAVIKVFWCDQWTNPSPGALRALRGDWSVYRKQEQYFEWRRCYKQMIPSKVYARTPGCVALEWCAALAGVG
jgi:hypothetical protein